jgi:hypothetical protein
VNLADAAATALLAVGSVVLVIAGVGAALPRNAFVRLHYLGLTTMVGAPLASSSRSSSWRRRPPPPRPPPAC